MTTAEAPKTYQYMYLAPSGMVMTGSRTQLPNPLAANQVNGGWKDRDGRAQGPLAITEEWRRVVAMQADKDKGPEFFEASALLFKASLFELGPDAIVPTLPTLDEVAPESPPPTIPPPVMNAPKGQQSTPSNQKNITK